jgi:hypothetical protein
MDRSDRYRHFAKECLGLAQSKVTFLVMAQVWNRLADEHDREAKVTKRTSATRKTH